MYLRLSSGSRGTRGSASTDQSSCQRLNKMAGRGDAWSSAWTDWSAPAVPPPDKIRAATQAWVLNRIDSFAGQRMNLGDIAPGEQDHRRSTIPALIGLHQHGRVGALGLGQGFIEILDLVAGQLATVGVRQMTVGHEGRQLAENGLDANAPVSVAGPADLDARRLRLIGDDLAVREPNIALHEGGASQRRDIDAVFGHGLKRRIRRRCRVPVDLRVHAARPLNDRVTADWVGEWLDKNIRTCGACGFDRNVHVGDEEAGPLGAEGKGNRSLEAEERDGTNGGLQELRGRAARHRRYRGDHLLGALATKGREEARDETVDVCGCDVHMGRVVLRPHRHGRGSRWRRSRAMCEVGRRHQYCSGRQQSQWESTM